MKIKILILSIFSISLISAKGGCNSENKNSDPIIGEWKWVKSFCCGRTSKWTTPEDCNCNKSLSIKDDGTFVLTTDGAIEKEGSYTLRKGINDYQYQQGDSALTIKLGENDFAAYVRFNGDTLLLARGYMDFTNDYYVRQSK